MTVTDIVFTGYYHMIGRTVSVSIGGLDCGDYVVAANGLITVPIQSDPDGLLDGAYLATIDAGPYDLTTYGEATTPITLKVVSGLAAGEQTVYVPVVIGYTYPSIGQQLRSMSKAETNSPQGPAAGTTKRSHQFGALMRTSVGVSFGTDFNFMLPAQFTDQTEVDLLLSNDPFSGILWDTIDDDYGFDSQLCWQTTRPYPTTVVAIGDFGHTIER